MGIERCGRALVAVWLLGCAPEGAAPDPGPAGEVDSQVRFEIQPDIRICKVPAKCEGLGNPGLPDCVFDLHTSDGTPNGPIVAYACKEACTGAAEACVFRRGGGAADIHFFTVDGAGGFLREHNVAGTDGLVFWAGDAVNIGDCDPDGVPRQLDMPAEIVDAFADKDIGVVSPRFMTGGKAAGTGQTILCSGWWTMVDGNRSSGQRFGRKMRNVMHWAHEQLSGGRPFGYVGYGGGGSGIGIAALIWNDAMDVPPYSVNAFVDFWHFTAGPPAFDTLALCGGVEHVSEFPLLCMDDPTVDCDDQGQGCSASVCTDRYRVPRLCDFMPGYPCVPATEGPALMQYGSGSSGNLCVTGGWTDAESLAADPDGYLMGELSSVAHPPPGVTLTLANRGPMGFAVCGDESGVAGVSLSDSFTGTAAHAGRIYRLMTGPKRWYYYPDCKASDPSRLGFPRDNSHWSKEPIVPGTTGPTFIERNVDEIKGLMTSAQHSA